jgi:hypothetical protein
VSTPYRTRRPMSMPAYRAMCLAIDTLSHAILHVAHDRAAIAVLLDALDRATGKKVAR